MIMSNGCTFLSRFKTLCVGFVIGLLASACLCAWYTHYKKSVKIETAAAESRQADGSLVLERNPTNQKVKPVHAVPKGGKAERVVRVDVQPERTDCPLCTVDLTLVRMPDDGLRVVASSPTGTGVGGLDVPIVPLSITKKRLWGVGGSRGTNADSWGLWLGRDFAMVRTGIELNKTGEDQAGEIRFEARVKLGFTF